MIFNFLFLNIVCLIINIFILFRPSKTFYGPLFFGNAISCIFYSFVPIDLFFNLPIRVSKDFGKMIVDKFTIEALSMSSIFCISLTFISLIFIKFLPIRNLEKESIKPIHNILNYQINYSQKNINKIIILVFIFGLLLFSLDYILVSEKITDSLGSYKHERIAARSGSLLLSLLSYAYNVFSALCTVCILYSKTYKDKLIKVIFPFVLLTALYYSQTSNIIIWLIVYFLKYSKHFFPKLKNLLLFFVPTFSLMYLGLNIKVLANIFWISENSSILSFITLKEKLIGINNFYFSKFEGLSAFEVTRYLLENKKALNAFNGLPILDSIKAFNIFNSDTSVSSFYTEYIRGELPGSFSFSPIAESYLATKSIYVAPVLAAFIFILVIYAVSLSKNKWLILILIQYILRFNRLDLYSSFRRYFVVEMLAVFISLILIKYFTKIKYKNFISNLTYMKFK